MYAMKSAIEEAAGRYGQISEETRIGIDNLRQLFEAAAHYEVDYSDEERTLLAVENETDEELIAAVVEGLLEDMCEKLKE
jgi:hypothetical protein